MINGSLLALHAARIQLALGQFGTDSWSMTDLRDLPVSSMSIDSAFIERLAQSTDDKTIISSLVSLAHDLGLPCVAEGVKDREQANTLDAIGCDNAVGPYWGPPVPEVEVALLLERLGHRRAGDRGPR